MPVGSSGVVFVIGVDVEFELSGVELLLVVEFELMFELKLSAVVLLEFSGFKEILQFIIKINTIKRVILLKIRNFFLRIGFLRIFPDRQMAKSRLRGRLFKE